MANCGDSKAALLTPGLGAQQETLEHKPSASLERERVESEGMELHTTIHDDGRAVKR